MKNHRNIPYTAPPTDHDGSEGLALSFGTGGVRAAEGVGLDHVNDITVGGIAAALAKAVNAGDFPRRGKGKEILIGYDTRKNSRLYAETFAAVLNEKLLSTCVFPEPVPVPLLSYTLKMGTFRCGVMITASHNPAVCNGVKIYDGGGVQLLPGETVIIERIMRKTDPFAVCRMDRKKAEEKGLCRLAGEAPLREYRAAVGARRVADSPLKAVVTPLYGSAAILPREILERCGHSVFGVEGEEIADPSFGGLAAPNPEDPAVFAAAERVGAKVGADLLLATDGDGDRCGCCARSGKRFVPLSGNETAALLVHYLCGHEEIPREGFIVRSVVSGETAEAVAADHGLKTVVTPTGFKYIGDETARDGEGRFFAGYEESGGFLFRGGAADIDGIAAAALLAEAAAVYKKEGKTLIDILRELREKYGAERTLTERFVFPGADGEARRRACEAYFALNPFPDGEIDFFADTLIFRFPGRIRTALRPSGTESCLKVYHRATAPDPDRAGEMLAKTKRRFDDILTVFRGERI